MEAGKAVRGLLMPSGRDLMVEAMAVGRSSLEAETSLRGYQG